MVRRLIAWLRRLVAHRGVEAGIRAAVLREQERNGRPLRPGDFEPEAFRGAAYDRRRPIHGGGDGSVA